MQPDGSGFEPEIASIGRRVKVYEHALILRPLSVVLEDDVRIDAFTRIEGGQFTWIGKGTHIASFSSILGGGECIIGAYCAIAQGVRIITGVGHPLYMEMPCLLPQDDVHHVKRGKVVIGDYVFIGTNCIIHQGITIGEGAAISAGSIIGQDVPPWSIVAGNPARVIGKREQFIKESA